MAVLLTGMGVIPEFPAIVTITGSGNANYSYVTINGTKYTSAATLEVEPGTVITAHVGTYTTAGMPYTGVIVDGSIVLANIMSGDYNYTVTDDCAIELVYTPSGTMNGQVYITTS